MTNQCVQGCFVVPPELSLALAKPPLLQETWDELFQSADKDAASYHSFSLSHEKRGKAIE
jgi:hypothetical protein